MTVNKVILIGFVGKDPYIDSKNQKVRANFSLATNEKFTDKLSGEKKTVTDWHEIVAFGKVAEVIRDLVKKGSRIYIEGRLKYYEKTNEHGQSIKRSSILLEQFQLFNEKKGDTHHGTFSFNQKTSSVNSNW